MSWVRKMTGALGLNRSPRIRKILVAVIGGTIVVVGVVLLVLPGPASLVIPIGLIVLASEFAWARYVLRRGKLVVNKARRGVQTAASRGTENVSSS
jgi:Putative transmembrane protein (PGPGW)